MTIRELYDFLDKKIPKTLSIQNDNDGLMCCADPERKAKKVLFALDVTTDVITYAVQKNFDTIIAHHPLIYRGIKEINDGNFVASRIIQIVKNNITVMSFHTRLDALEGGVNDTLCGLFGVTNTLPFGIGRIGEIDTECTLEEFAHRVRTVLEVPFVLAADAGRKVKKVAVIGGSGGSYVDAAKTEGADTLVAGRLGYHEMTDAPDMGINLIEAGHFYTENPVLDKLISLVRETDENIICEKISSNRIKFI